MFAKPVPFGIVHECGKLSELGQGQISSSYKIQVVLSVLGIVVTVSKNECVRGRRDTGQRRRQTARVQILAPPLSGYCYLR